jgi:hypothetical protein
VALKPGSLGIWGLIKANRRIVCWVKHDELALSTEKLASYNPLLCPAAFCHVCSFQLFKVFCDGAQHWLLQHEYCKPQEA